MTFRAPPRRRRAGFALLITITLVAFLVLILVSVATITRVETTIAGNHQEVAKARQNALMGLNIALGQLQLMMGPDTRVSAPASQRGDGLPSYSAADADNNPNWIGVYRQNPSAADTQDPQLLTWLVSGNQSLAVTASSANAPSVTPDSSVTVSGAPLDKSVNAETTGLKIGSRDAVMLVGPASTLEVPVAVADNSTVERFVVAPVEPINASAGSLPGFDASASPTIGHFAYWVGDEGMKAKVSIDPWTSPSSAIPPTPAAQAEDYRFINAQRMGIEGVGRDTADTKLGADFPGADPAFQVALPKVISLPQLPFAGQSASTRIALGQAIKTRFHDLTINSHGLPVDVAKGGLKRDLSAWLKTSTSNPLSSPAADDDYITPGDPADTVKFSLPKWQLIRDYAGTFTGSAPVEPRLQSATRQGIYPVITYVRMGYNLTCAAADTPPDFNIMPVVTLWNPHNVKLAAKTYEFCVQYSNITPASGGGLRYKTGAYAADPTLEPEDFDLTLIRVKHGFSPIISTEYGENTSDSEAEYFRFKLEVSRDMEPGESRIFTICDPSDSVEGFDGTVYKSGVSRLSDRGALRNDVGVNNAVRMPGKVPFNAQIAAQTQTIFFASFPEVKNPPFFNSARMEVLLTEPLPSSISVGNISAVRQFLRANAYQKILGAGFEWRWTLNSLTIPPANTGEPLFYHRLELMMSDMQTATDVSGRESNPLDKLDKPNPGAPRWLSTLNPQASTMLRKPFVEQTGSSNGYRSNFNPSYLTEVYMRPPAGGLTLDPHVNEHPIPNADSQGRVSSGTRVSITSGGAPNMGSRESPSPNVPLFSIAPLQHANTSLINLNPAYAIGNSNANVYVNRNASFTALNTDDTFALSDPTGFPDKNVFNRIYDLSYWLNQALWDGYFFSTVPDTVAQAQANTPGYRLPNGRHELVWSGDAATAAEITALKTVDQAAAHLRVDGGFNVNSASVQAWRALLYSHNGVAVDPANSLNKHPFSRFSTVLSAPFPGSTPNDTWMGHRILSDAEIDDLAPRIVAEIRARGPFLSLADFVNRRLVADRTGLKGVLQAAIDAGTVNQSSAADGLKADTYPRDIKDSSGKIPQDIEQQIVYSGTVNAANTGPDTAQSAASRASLTPGYLSQADLLTAVGPSLSARSDTFRIRAYGDSQNPVTGEIGGRAWCEAIVQRGHEYVDTADDPAAAPASLRPANLTFGRKFKIISFRWLSADDI